MKTMLFIGEGHMMKRSRTLIAVFGVIASSLVAIAACVGADPGSENDGGTGAETSTSTETGTNDSAANDSSKVTDATSDGDAADAGPRPDNVAAANLQLWLTADKELTCVPGDAGGPNRAILWKDQSSFGRVATPSALPPQCNVHTIAGKDVPYFSAAGNTSPFNGETFSVDLGFLAQTPYTILIVERRWADRQNGNILIGTRVPGESMGNPAFHDKGLFFGYLYTNPPVITLDQYYNRVGGSSAAVAPAAKASLSVAWFDPAVGHRIYVDGNQVGASTDDAGLSPLLAAENGYIGAGVYINAADGRFIGDIAEVIAYNKALTDTERKSIEVYVRQHWGLSF